MLKTSTERVKTRYHENRNNGENCFQSLQKRQTNIKITKINEINAKIHHCTKNTTDGSRSRRVGILMLSPPWLNGL